MLYIPPIKKLADDATQGDHDKAYWAAVDMIARMNPGYVLPVGVKKRWYHLFKIEHPRTAELEKPQITSNRCVCRLCGK